MYERKIVGDICQRDVVSATENMSLKEAARLMRDKHVGSLVVVKEGSIGKLVVGMLTDRDITVMGVARDFDPQTLRVSDIMSGDPVCAHPEEDTGEVLARMRKAGVRRIPVTSAEGVLQGIISLDDLLDVVADEMNSFVQAIRGERMYEARVRV